jgi:protocatechuate 3,4-dioxygenase beta subunit
MKKRTVGVGAVGAVVVIAGLLSWRCAGGGGASDQAAGPAAAGAGNAGSASTAGRRPRVDPRTLARGSVAGAVTDDKQAPIPKARVCAAGESDELPDELLRAPACVTADDQGRFRIGGLLPARYAVSASARPFRPGAHHPGGNRRKTRLPLAPGEHRTGVDITLHAGGVELTGTVSDLTGGPVAGAKLRTTGGWRNRTAAAVHAEADEHGRFSLWVAPGAVHVIASADGYAEAEEWGRAPGELDLLLTPESSLSGIVVDAATGQPVEGARVIVSESERGWDDDRDATFTNAQGQFRAARLTPGRHVAVARDGRGYGRTEGSVRVGLGQHVEGVVIKLFPAVRVEGKVVVSTTQAVCEDAVVWLSDPVRPDREISARRSADGTLSAEGMLPGSYKVDVQCEGYRERDPYAPVVVADKDVTGLVWEVDPGATVRGKVLARSGDPIEGAWLQARVVGGPARAKDGHRSDTSAHDGAYELTGLKPGSYQLELETDRGVPPQDGYRVEVAPGETVTRDLVVDDGGTIRGTVADAAGKPVVGVEVHARAGANFTWRWPGTTPRSDDTGAFTLEGVKPGDYHVVAQRSWFDTLRKPGTTDDAKQGERVTVRAGQTSTVRLVVESQAQAIRGTVVDAAGKPVDDAFVSAARESDAAGARPSNVSITRWDWGDEKPALTGVDGAFTIGKLSPGKYTLRAYRKGGGEAVAEHVPAGGTARLQIKPTGSIEGTARRGAEPPTELTVTVSDPLTGLVRRERFFRTRGRFAVRDLPKGRLRIEVEAEGGQKEVEVELAEGEAKTGVDVELDAVVDITGRVVDRETAQPVPGMMMFAAPARTSLSVAFRITDTDGDHVTDEGGRFKIKNAPAGQVLLRGVPKDFGRGDYAFWMTARTVDPKRPDLGDVPVLKARVKRGDPVGELGAKFVQPPEDTPFFERELKVSYIDPAGPAAKTELKVGDILTSVDGIDVTGGNIMNAWTRMRAPPGTRLVLGLKRGAQVTVVLAAP